MKYLLSFLLFFTCTFVFAQKKVTASKTDAAKKEAMVHLENNVAPYKEAALKIWDYSRGWI